MKKPNIFVSYSRKDIQAAEKILQELENAGFDVWRDKTDIEPGANWSREIAYSLATRDIIVLLWSGNAASSLAVKHERLTARALEKGIIPCFLEPLKELPAEARLPQPLENINGIHFGDFTTGMKQLLQILENPSAIYTGYDYTQMPPHSFIPFRPNPDFAGRHGELLELYLTVIEGLNNIVLGINQIVNVFGLGGIGKTRLAVEFAYRFGFAFPEGVWWLNAAQDWKSEFAALALEIGLSVDGSSSAESYDILLPRLRRYISEHKSMLLIMDNVADPLKLGDELVRNFVPTTLGCPLLFTSRSQELPVGAKSLEVKVLDNEAAYRLLTTQNPPASGDEETYARDICSILGNLPLALRLAGIYLREKKVIITYELYLQNIQKRRLQVLEEKSKGIRMDTGHDPSLVANFESQYELVKDENAKDLFKLAGQLPEAEIIPVARLGLLAGIEDRPKTLDTPFHDAVAQLIKIFLMEQLQDNRVRLHPLLREFAESLVPAEERAKFRQRAAGYLQAAALRLGREYSQRGIDSVVEDVQVGIDWSDSDTPCGEELSQLQRLLDLERHNLRAEMPAASASQLKTQLFQQLHYRAHNIGAQKAASKFIAAMYIVTKPCFKLCGQQSFEDPAWLRTFKGHSGLVTSVSFSPDGKRALSGSWDGTLILWDVESGKPIRTFEGHSDLVNAVSFSPDGKRALSGSGDKTLILLWDVESDKPIRTFEGHSDLVNAVSFSPDGKRALSGSGDKTLILWDVESGKPIRTFEGHSDLVNAVSFSPDGKRALSGSYDKTLILWDVESGSVLCRLYVDRPVTSLSLVGTRVAFGDQVGLVQFLEIVG